MTESAISKRDVSLDITRIFAFVSVPAIHFFLNSGYYSVPVEGKRMYLMTYGRTFFMVCVPLFMILSGYLMITKDINLEKKSIFKFYSKLAKVLVTYLLTTLAIIIYRVYFLKEPLSVQDGVFNILGYKQYAWYVNMYIGCYLLVPLLNALWKVTDTKHGHFCIVIILCALTVAPSIFNAYDFLTPNALIKPWLSVSYNQIVPNWWSSIYPITYYYIGAYLRTNIDVKKLKTWKILLLLICSVSIFGTYNIWRSYSIIFVWGPWCDWGSLQNTVNATLVFLLINSISIPSPNVYCREGNQVNFRVNVRRIHYIMDSRSNLLFQIGGSCSWYTSKSELLSNRCRKSSGICFSCFVWHLSDNNAIFKDIWLCQIKIE